LQTARLRRWIGGYSLNAAIAVSPLLTVTLFDFVAPLGGRQVTE
jgi:hypothetical protein